MEHRYQKFFCEENIWHLCQEAQFSETRCAVTFVSNERRSVAICYQGDEPSNPVVWDYHVILLVFADSTFVWDLDSTLGFPVAAPLYFDVCFPSFPEPYSPRFRVVDRDEFVAEFRSDRSHMVDSGVPFPEWPQISKSTNLDRFVSMDPNSGPGRVVDLNAIRELAKS